MNGNYFDNKGASKTTDDRPRRKPDKRVPATKRAIHNAFVKLVGEKDFNDITIKDIADKAGINRKTFYYYYAGIHSLIDEIENGFANGLKELMENVEFPEGANSIDILLRKITDAVSRDVEFFRHLMKAGRDNGIIAKLTDTVKNSVKKQLEDYCVIDEESSDFIADFCTAGLFEVYRLRFNSGKELRLDEIADKLERILFGGLKNFLRDFERK